MRREVRVSKPLGHRLPVPITVRLGISGIGFTIPAAADALHFLLENVEIRRGDAFIFLNDDVAGAEKAEAFAERDVHVERNWSAGMLGLLMDAFEIGWAKGVVPDRGGGITGITRAGAIVLSEEIFADMKLAAHLVEAGMCECHAKNLLAHLRGGSGMLNQCALTGFDKELGVFDRSILQDAMAQVEDVAMTVE